MSTYRGPRCRSCNGPCWQWKGSVWGYTCAACIAEHQHAAAERADARDQKARRRTLSKVFGDKTFPAVSKVASGR
ncbi:hypothetical protein [Mycobacterium intracellulare]|uniref:hypothetical protein n=1 Tax=Mycobacterium intracellulare TaxID=1767 RepID=UPI001916B9D7|nr:hypothetical protein [Mycobacterium intracellulare]MCA2356771.1 hypothetical protein [Mycobacterium intracellulare]MCA2367689.1 hypothetical protein [Mycobacterium intracellulare]